jgi:hypothetical protein
LRHVITGIGEKAKQSGIPAVKVVDGIGFDPESVVVVAGVQDYVYVRERASDLAYLEHGVGQPYITNGPGDMNQASGPGRDKVSLRLCTMQRVAETESRTYPDSRSVTVGAPKLDAFVDLKKTRVASSPSWRYLSTGTTRLLQKRSEHFPAIVPCFLNS